jgi:hypothetical protein
MATVTADEGRSSATASPSHCRLPHSLRKWKASTRPTTALRLSLASQAVVEAAPAVGAVRSRVPVVAEDDPPEDAQAVALLVAVEVVRVRLCDRHGPEAGQAVGLGLAQLDREVPAPSIAARVEAEVVRVEAGARGPGGGVHPDHARLPVEVDAARPPAELGAEGIEAELRPVGPLEVAD